MKAQIVVDKESLNVICFFISKGKCHDFNMFKKSRLGILSDIQVIVDSGYQGISHYHKNSKTPIKSSKNHKLSPKEKQYNRSISKKRIYVEHVNRYLKRFHILSSRYRNKRRKFGLRFYLICGIYNFQH